MKQIKIHFFLWYIRGTGTWTNWQSRFKTGTEWKKTSPYRPTNDHEKYFAVLVSISSGTDTLSRCLRRGKTARNIVVDLSFFIIMYTMNFFECSTWLAISGRLWSFNLVIERFTDDHKQSQTFIQAVQNGKRWGTNN